MESLARKGLPIKVTGGFAYMFPEMGYGDLAIKGLP